MKINKYSIENFKAFRDKQEINISPITMIYGQNSSGKSSIMQSLRLLAKSFQTNRFSNVAALSLSTDSSIDLGSYEFFVHGQNSDEEISFGFDYSEPVYKNRNFSTYISGWNGCKISLRFSKDGLAKLITESKIVSLDKIYDDIEELLMDSSMGGGLRSRISPLRLRTNMIRKLLQLIFLTTIAEEKMTLEINFDNNALDQYQDRNSYGHLKGFVDDESNVKKYLILNFLRDLSRQFFYTSKLNIFYSAAQGKILEKHINQLIKYIKPSLDLIFNEKIGKNRKKLIKEFIENIDHKNLKKIYDRINSINTRRIKKYMASLDTSFPLYLDGNYNVSFVRNEEDDDLLLLDEEASNFTTSLNFFYIGPYRFAPERYITTSLNFSKNYVGSDGENAYRLLLENTNLLDELNSWFKKFDIPYEVEPLSQNLKFGEVNSLTLKDLNNPKVKVTPKDVGFGISQLIPIIIQGLISRSQKSHIPILIEQPELHLHPKLQGNLADFFVDTSMSGVNWIIETHSENIILRIQKLVRDKKIEKNDISVNYVEKEGNSKQSKIIPLRLNERGSFIDQWPGGFFEERFDIFD